MYYFQKAQPTQKQESRQLLLPVVLEDPTVAPPTQRFDRQSPDYHEYYDYSYYMDFEVLKMGAEVKTEAPAREVTKAEEERDPTLPPIMGLPVKENPAQGESQGCLYDCVYDCVSIIQLSAYRDCVHFCGTTCKDK